MGLDDVFEPKSSNAADSELLDSNDASEPLFTSENMNILNNVDLEITVEIGRAKMKISDLLNLKKGSVIELAQAADEPLQIFANDKPIAKGVIMSINGKYCVKVT
jgi:flagellar motor switch protein FliN